MLLLTMIVNVSFSEAMEAIERCPANVELLVAAGASPCTA